MELASPRKTTRTTIAPLFVIGFVLLGSPLLGQQDQLEQKQQIQTMAVVNGQSVTRQQLANESLRRFGEDVLESIVNKQLVFNECQRLNIVITEKDVNDEIVKEAAKFGMSSDRYVQLITTQRNISLDRYKNDVVWSKLALKRLAVKSLDVKQEEINERMEFEFGSKVQVREIAVDSMELAQQLQAQAVQNPALFERLAIENSLNPNSASIGGILPPIRRNSGMKQFEDVAFTLQVGEVSNVFQIEDKYFILKCERVFPAVELSTEQLSDVHGRIVDEIMNAKLATAAAQLFQRLQTTVKITNVINDPELSKQMPGVAAMVDSTEITKRYLAEECIVRFGTDLLETEINRTLLMQALRKQNLQVTQDDINEEISRAAKAFGHLKPDGSVDLDRWFNFVSQGDKSKIDFYIEDEVWPSVALKKLVSAQVSVTQEDMQKGFESNFGPRVRVLAIVLTEHRQALKVWQMASANPNKEYFSQLAHQYSIEPASKNNHGEVPPIQRHGGRPELETEAFSLQPDKLSKVIQVGEHWVIMYCLGQTTPRVNDFDAVKNELERNILEKKMRVAMSVAFEKLQKQSQIDNFLTGTSQPGQPTSPTSLQSGN